MENLEHTPKHPPMGNCVVKKIIDHPGQGLSIRWARSDLKPTRVWSDGVEEKLYRHLVKEFSDLSDAPGTTVTISTDKDGLPIAIGRQGGEIVSIEEELKKSGLL